MTATTQWRKSREIVERIVIEGTLVLETPTSLGNGDTEGLTDMPLVTDPLKGNALLTGTSIAGALRNYLREYLLSYGVTEESEFKDKKGERLKVKDANGKEVNKPLPIVTRLFGSLEDDGEQSPLIVDDSIGEKPKTELRDGVRIEGKTRTAFVDEKGKGAKFDLELLEAGTEFPLRFELVLCEGHDCREFNTALAATLQGFEEGEIHLGGRKRRGYGQCRVGGWTVRRYDLKSKEGLLAWLNDGEKKSDDRNRKPIIEAINDAYRNCEFAVEGDALKDERACFKLKAKCALDGSLLIRSGSKLPGASDKAQPDTVHLRSKRKRKDTEDHFAPIVSGTSLAGVLRHRALRIAKTIATGEKQPEAEKLVERIFGVDMNKLENRNEELKRNGKAPEQPFASRLEVCETEVIEDATNDLVQTRVRIDRFTGGAYEGALFDTAPVFAKEKKPAINICLMLREARLRKENGELETPGEVRNRTMAEIGIILLLLKDLWTGDLAIGGESSTGRGRLQGIFASLEYRNGAGSWDVELGSEINKPDHVQFNKEELMGEKIEKFLNEFVVALNTWLGNKPQGGAANE